MPPPKEPETDGDAVKVSLLDQKALAVGVPATSKPPGQAAEGPPTKKASQAQYSLSSAYGWLIHGLRRDGLTTMSFATLVIGIEGICANQPAVLLGQIVDIVGAPGDPDASLVWPIFGLIGLSLVGKEICTVSRKFMVERTATNLQKSAFLDQDSPLPEHRLDHP